MSIMVTGTELSEAVTKGTFLQGGISAAVEGVKYDLRLSSRILKAKFGRPVDADALSEAEKRDLKVEPGEVVFVLTEERLTLPMDMFVQLSPKRKLSHAGILTLGGFCVDPGYEGRLLIGLFNLSSSPFQLWPGKKLIGATFFRLAGEEVSTFKAPGGLDDFPEELVDVMQKYQPVAMQALVETVARLQSELTSLKASLRDHEEWYRRFQGIVDVHNSQIGTLSRDLAAEAEVRKSGQDKLTEAVQSVRETLTFLRGASWVGLGILAIVVTILIGGVLKLLGWV